MQDKLLIIVFANPFRLDHNLTPAKLYATITHFSKHFGSVYGVPGTFSSVHHEMAK